MLLYAMSPKAYDGLMELAEDNSWSSDYARILRYLEVAVSFKEVERMTQGQTVVPVRCDGWKQVAFMESAEHLRTARPVPVCIDEC